MPAPPTNARRNTDETADVDVWNTRDERIQSMQMVRAAADRNFTFRQAFDVAALKFVKLSDDTLKDLDIGPDGKWAVGRDTRGYIHDYKRPAADLYRVNTSTGERTLILKDQLIGSHVLGISPNGKYFLYWRDRKFNAYDLDAGTSLTLGGHDAGELRRHGIRPAGPEALVRRRGLHEGRKNRDRPAPVRSLGAAARRLGPDEPHQRHRREGRDPVPLRAYRAA